MQWLRLDNADRLHAADEARRHLSRMPKREQLGLIAIFGSARQGKSFLMNKLAGGDGCGFKVSNKHVKTCSNKHVFLTSPLMAWATSHREEEGCKDKYRLPATLLGGSFFYLVSPAQSCHFYKVHLGSESEVLALWS